jgi:hypothetical protein
MTKKYVLLTVFLLIGWTNAEAQWKDAARMATLTPTYFVVTADMENYKKLHYMVSTVGYMASYMITDSVWKSVVITLGAGIAKELIYDGLFGRGEPLWEDMKWNALGTGQGVLFTVSLKF